MSTQGSWVSRWAVEGSVSVCGCKVCDGGPSRAACLSREWGLGELSAGEKASRWLSRLNRVGAGGRRQGSRWRSGQGGAHMAQRRWSFAPLFLLLWPNNTESPGTNQGRHPS